MRRRPAGRNVKPYRSRCRRLYYWRIPVHVDRICRGC
uniref:Uncharacterized protein n=1 Tax=Setaria italica TaxID=4555 RepID=K3XU38_SETIT